MEATAQELQQLSELASKSAILLTKLELPNARMVLDRLKYRCAEPRVLQHFSYE
jgi:hypothetical protein